MKPLRFKHPVNGYILEIERPVFWALLIGPLFFAAKGIWKPLIFCVIGAFLTAGVSILIQLIVLPMYAHSIFRNHYLMRGWTDVTDQKPEDPVKTPARPTTPARPAVQKKTVPVMNHDDGGIPTYRL